MKKSLTILSILFISIAFIVPAPVSAATSAGVKPGSFFYLFDTTFEKIGLFFTFNPEQKAKKALEYANERLAEIESVAEDKNPDAVKIALASYEENVALAIEKSKDVKDKIQAENLFTSIEDTTAKNHEALSAVLIKVPEEAKAAIEKAIEASKKGQEEAAKQMTELKKEVLGLKQQLEDLKAELKDKEATPQVGEDKKDEQIKTINKLKDEIENLKQKVSEPKEKEAKIDDKKDKTEEPKNSTVNLPNGAVVEMDSNGNIVRTIKEALEQTHILPLSAQSQVPTTVIHIQISAVNVEVSLSSARIEWQTNIPTDSKIFISGGSLSSKVYNSESGLSTRHIVNLTNLVSGTTYSYEIESIAGVQVVKKEGSFLTKPDEYDILIQPDKTSVQANEWNSASLKVSILKNGQLQTNKNISMFTPDSTQNQTRSDGGSFTYYPKTVGTHNIVFSWNGISKSVDIKAVEYIKIDPKIERRTIYQQDSNNIDYTIEIPEYPIGYQGATIAAFGLSNADEPFRIGEIKFESDIDVNKLRIWAGSLDFNIFGSGAPLNQNTTLYQIKIYDTTGMPTGTHTFTIKEMRAIGQTSGLYRAVSSLPITFTFKIK
ncbi:MAG: hypothetical protein HYT28_00350 [Parcubacteria group bacterium]|nr:hypothetical protein [Parcubacteria group bacterium]